MQQMADQPAYRPLEPSPFFNDGRSARPLEPGTVARGHLDENTHLHTGRRSEAPADARDAGAYADTFPLPVTMDLLKRGRDRYQVFCAMCHGPLGQGDGKIVQRGFTPPPSYHDDMARGLKDVRLRDAPVGYYYDVVTNGYGAMASYATQVPRVEDRWALVAYVRALQVSQNVRVQDLTEEERQNLGKGEQ
jgi:mono/diheme cytochrome c family protein